MSGAPVATAITPDLVSAKKQSTMAMATIDECCPDNARMLRIVKGTRFLQSELTCAHFRTGRNLS